MSFFKHITVLMLLANLFSLGGQPQAQTGKLDFETWEKITTQISSRQKVQRIWAIRQALRYRSERTMNLIKERLLVETDNEVADLILTILEGRKNRRDFFYVLDYMKITADRDLSVRAMRLLYDIHPPRLYYELNQLMQKKYGKIFFLVFLQAVKKPSSSDTRFLEKAYTKFKIGYFMLSLPDRSYEVFLEALAKLLNENKVLKNPSAASFYWYLKSRITSNKPVSPAVLTAIKLKHLEELPTDRQKDLLRMLLKQNAPLVDPKILVFSSSAAARKLVALIYLDKRKYASRIARDQLAYEQAFERMLQRETSRFWLLPVSVRFQAFNQNEKRIWQQRCDDGEIVPSLCFKVLLSHNVSAALAKWNQAGDDLKDRLAEVNLQTMLLQREFIAAGLVNWCLNHHFERFRLKVILHFKPEHFKKYHGLLISHWLAENDRTIRQLMLAKIRSDDELEKLYKPYIYEVYLTRVQELPEKKKKEAQPEETSVISQPAENKDTNIEPSEKKTIPGTGQTQPAQTDEIRVNPSEEKKSE